MFGIGTTELLIILIFGFLIFGPDKLPKIARTIGHAIAKFREVREEAKNSVNLKDFIDSDSDEPFKDPIEAVEKVKDVAVKNARELKDDASKLASETKDSLKTRKTDVEKLKDDYDKKRAESNVEED